MFVIISVEEALKSLFLVITIHCFIWCSMQDFLLCFSQLTVVVKYFFQFGFFPWTTSAYRGINAERPFALPNIIGVEKKDGYVLMDLIQLLALFFHRSILKVVMKNDSSDTSARSNIPTCCSISCTGIPAHFPCSYVKLTFVSVTAQCHGLWDNKEVEMPDFFKKLKKKVDKTKMTGGDKTGSQGKASRRLKFLPLQASTTSIFCRRRKGDSGGSQDGEYTDTIRFYDSSIAPIFSVVFPS